MVEPVVLTDEQVAAEVERLATQLRHSRQERKITTRTVAAVAGINGGTLYRLEAGKHSPSLRVFCYLANALGLRAETEDGTDRPRIPLAEQWLWPYGLVGGLYASVDGVDESRKLLGAELWWARREELGGLTEEAACELLGMSHHTLRAVEFGSDWPYLTSVIRAAGLSGRRAVLVDAGADRRVPPWVP